MLLGSSPPAAVLGAWFSGWAFPMLTGFAVMLLCDGTSDCLLRRSTIRHGPLTDGALANLFVRERVGDGTEATMIPRANQVEPTDTSSP